MRKSIQEIITTLKTTGSVTQTARLLGITRNTVYRWKKKARRVYGYKHFLSWQGLKRQSTRPHKPNYKLPLSQKGKIIILRNKRHFGAKKIRLYLKLSVSPRTIHRFLTIKGLVAKQPDYRRPLFQNGKSMRPKNTTELGYLQMDTKHVTPELGGLPFTVYEYAAIDILSRYKLAVLLPDISDESASLALEFFLKWFPFPIKYIQTDNGLEYQQSFQQTCLKHNIDHYFIHKNSPNENAVIERSFRTDQDEFYFWLEKTPQHLGELNDWFQQFILLYNTDRPHQSLDYKTPLEAVKYYQSVS